ncbi:MAG: bacillithiol biosynthesis cysteine-adding enzyme BshC [Flavisolibacter sp.]
MFAAELLTYRNTHSFSKIVLDYLDGNESLKSFYAFSPTVEGIKKALEVKKQQSLPRQILADVLAEQYQGIVNAEKVRTNIESLRRENTFTVCTAHQPNLFTGPLYFIYKILHAVRLAEYLNKELPDHHFVPLFYMGCEDADLDELNHFTIRGKKYLWQTRQGGAVGRMTVDKDLLKLIDELEKQVSVEPHGVEWIAMLRECFTPGKVIQNATFEFVHRLMGKYGLIVFIPDHPAIKKQLINVFEDDLLHHTALEVVNQTSERLSQHYNVQAHVRPVNLFYLQDEFRERIEFVHRQYHVVNTKIHFSEEGMKAELRSHPERFSPNVILRGILQESILPNAAFIGGGGELAYWLQLKDLFDHYKVPYPVLVLRNSFMVVDKTAAALQQKLDLTTEDLFFSELEILNKLIERAGKKPELNGQLDVIREKYEQIKSLATVYDPTLQQHVDALKTKTLNHLKSLEKKMWSAERKRQEASQRQVAKLKRILFPKGLQERVENGGGFYAQWGPEFMDALYRHSPALDANFVVLSQTG